MSPATAEPKAMAKTQKTVMVPDDIYRLVAAIERISGASFTRITLAALLKYIFDGFQDPDPDHHPGPEALWMQLAVMVERGEVAVDDIPSELLASTAKDVQWSISFWEQGDSKDRDKHLEEMRAMLRALETARKQWDANVKDFCGKSQAIEEMLKGRFVKPTT